jgi:hypothetical protein
MLLVAEREVPDPPSLPLPTPSPTPTPTQTTQSRPNLQQEYIARLAWKQGVLGALNLATAILAIRLILLLAVCGAVALAWVALASADPMRLAALGVYTLSVVGPLVWLAARHH